MAGYRNPIVCFYRVLTFMSKSIGYLLLRVLGIFMPVNCKLDFIEKTSFLTHGEVRSRLGVDVI